MRGGGGGGGVGFLGSAVQVATDVVYEGGWGGGVLGSAVQYVVNGGRGGRGGRDEGAGGEGGVGEGEGEGTREMWRRASTIEAVYQACRSMEGEGTGVAGTGFLCWGSSPKPRPSGQSPGCPSRSWAWTYAR